MEELKFTEPKEFFIEKLNKTVLIKDYMLVEEINEIVNICKNETPITRDILMYSLILDKCTDMENFTKIEKEKNEGEEISINIDIERYDLYKTNGIISEILDKIDEQYIIEIEQYISELNSLNTMVKEMTCTIEKWLESTNRAINKVSKGDLNKVIENLVSKVKELTEKR